MPSNTPFEYGSSVHTSIDSSLSVPLESLFFQSILDKVQDICFIVSPDGGQLYYLNNAEYKDLLGFYHDELICMSVKAVVTPASLTNICDSIHKTVAEKSVSINGCIECAPFYIELIKKDRTLLQGTVYCTLLMSADHTILQIGGIIRLSKKESTAVKMSASAAVTETTVDSGKDTGTVTGKNSLPGKILIMDDEDILIDIALQMGKRLGLIVETASNGEEALKMYRDAYEKEYPYDAVLLDMTISGGMGGIEASRQLHEIDEHVVTIVMSGYSDHEVMAKPHEYGFSGVISKPFRLNEFSKVLHDQIPEEKFRNGSQIG